MIFALLGGAMTFCCTPLFMSGLIASFVRPLGCFLFSTSVGVERRGASRPFRCWQRSASSLDCVEAAGIVENCGTGYDGGLSVRWRYVLSSLASEPGINRNGAVTEAVMYVLCVWHFSRPNPSWFTFVKQMSTSDHGILIFNNSTFELLQLTKEPVRS